MLFKEVFVRQEERKHQNEPVNNDHWFIMSVGEISQLILISYITEAERVGLMVCSLMGSLLSFAV